MSRVSINAYFKLALDLHKSGKLPQARKIYQEVLNIDPKNLDSLFMIGQSFYQEANFEMALEYFDKLLTIEASNVNFLLQKGKTLIKLGRHEEAKLLFGEMIKAYPTNPSVLFHSARNMKAMGQYESAIELYNKVIKLEPENKKALNNLANAYQQVHDYKNSMQCYDRLITLDQNFIMAHCNKAGLLQKMNQLVDAERLYHDVLEIDKSNAIAMYNLGVIHNRRFEYKQAIGWIEQSIKYSPNNHKYLSTYAHTLYQLGKKVEAISILRKLIETGSVKEEPYLKLARIYMSEHQLTSVIELLEPYIHKNPYSYEAICLVGTVYDLTQQFEKAENCLTKINHHEEFALRANLILQLMYSKMGRMDMYEEMIERISVLLKKFITDERPDNEIPIYNLTYFPYDADLVTKATKRFSENLVNSIRPLRVRLQFKYEPKKQRIRIGYLSPYFKNHPAGQLVKDVLKNHNRERFEVIGYAIDGGTDEVNAEFRSLVDEYKELGNMKVSDAAKIINDDGVQILVSMAGYNYGMRSEIPALKPAPIQVICMDCHETMQADFYDYVFKDEVVLTEENRTNFSESIALLPPSHFFNTELIPSKNRLDRSTYGLPSDEFVFGCLNHPRKLNPWAIEAWAKILKQVPKSVLWLYDAGIDSFKTNIRDLMENEGVDASRILFCGREYQKDHYRRMELIDLFLDTPIYNGHTTCLEALWMSVPVLTVQGKSVSSRLCSSFLVAMNIKEMICQSMEEYVNKAVSLAQNQKDYQKVKNEFIRSRESSPFFDLKVLTKNMEEAYVKMWDKYEKGESPSDFKIA
ncbi:tetratricopeptide repeat protein [Ekhidna sp.]|uniref:O-linked N-acetylglucosamine transferase family protein n=1 Tax=Ekhidna sp. TaxID=2608089 RepID=UPI003B506B0C